MPQDFSSEGLLHVEENYSVFGSPQQNNQGEYSLNLNIHANYRLLPLQLNPIAPQPLVTIVNIVTQEDDSIVGNYSVSLNLGSGDMPLPGATKEYLIKFYEFPLGETIEYASLENYGSQNSSNSAAKKKERTIIYTRPEVKSLFSKIIVRVLTAIRSLKKGQTFQKS